MIRIEPVNIERLDSYRETRLAALKDTPLAFGSTYANESAFTPQQWLERIARHESGLSCAHLAFDDDAPCGIAGAFKHPDDPSTATLFSMWVAPTHRRLRVGEKLVRACVDWCRAQGVGAMLLHVTDWNVGAIAFYERLGFVKTGNTIPYPNDSKFLEFEMRKVL